MPEIGDHYFGSHSLGNCVPMKDSVGRSSTPLSGVYRKSLGLIEESILASYFHHILEILHKRVLFKYSFFGFNIVVVYWYIFAFLLGLVQCILRVVLKMSVYDEAYFSQRGLRSCMLIVSLQ